MGICIDGIKGDYSNLILLTQTDEEARWIADAFLTDVKVVHTIRDMCGYTGFYRGVRVSIQGTGVGNVSASMYVTELEQEFTPACIVKVDQCKALQEKVRLGDFVLAQSVHSTCGINRRRFGGKTFPAAADFDLLYQAYQLALERGKCPQVGPVASIETREELPIAYKFAEYGALALDLELNQIYTVANRAQTPVLAVLEVVENLVTGERYETNQLYDRYLATAEFALDLLTAQNPVPAPKTEQVINPHANVRIR